MEVFLKEATPAFDKLYIYQVPAELAASVSCGMRVLLPFGKGNRQQEAFVWSVDPDVKPSEKPIEYKLISELPDAAAVLTEDQLRLIAGLRIRYTCTYGEAAKLMIPPGAGVRVHQKREQTVYLSKPAEAIDLLNNGSLTYMRQVHVLEFLLNYGESAVSDVLAACQISRSTLNTMKKKDWLTFSERDMPPDSNETEDNAASYVKTPTVPLPTAGQAAALDRLNAALGGADERRIKEFLLRGITGSGKTEVYLQLCKSVLDKGKTAIILVPEISLTPQMTGRFRNRFGGDVAVIHSRLTPRQRYDQWQRILNQSVRLVVGARSAVFSPLKDLGLIVIDEEQEGSYQSEMKPRYHARTVARLRVRDEPALLLLGSATPDIESYFRTESDRSVRLELQERPGAAALPEAKIVDMREEVRAGNLSVFSRELAAAMEDSFSKQEQVILFLNRRGYAGVWICPDCGYSRFCPNCSVSMTYHMAFRNRPDSLQCHYCGRAEAARTACPKCSENHMHAFGLGTEQVETMFKDMFPNQRILRMDQDTTVGRGSHHEIVQAFSERKADVLLGTQMIAKGHDFPDVTTVGILGTDQLLLQNNYRAKEKAFQLITQAAGRAGRSDLGGRVYIQAFDVDDYALQHAVKQDYLSFYQDEIRFRKSLLYPPFTTMGLVLVSNLSNIVAEADCRELIRALQAYLNAVSGTASVELSPVARSPLARMNRRYRWQFTLKANQAQLIVACFTHLQQQKLSDETRVSVELDPA